MGVKLEAAVREGRTVFPLMVQDAPEAPTKGKVGVPLRALKWAGGNRKLGGALTKGPADWRGSPLFTLTLEERATCPSACPQWTSCYGSNMMWARRYRPNRALKRALEADLRALSGRYERFAIRLHVLGDFISPGYVRFWGRQLGKHPGLRIWGYTHWQAGTPIGDAVAALVLGSEGRVSILRSDPTAAGDPLAKAWVVPHDAPAPIPGSVFCPQETGRAESCGECGLCMLGRVSVSFLDHSPDVVRARELERRRLAVLGQ
jgi:hypothetical protein